MGAAYYIAMFQNVFAVFGLAGEQKRRQRIQRFAAQHQIRVRTAPSPVCFHAGILNSQRSLIVVFFTFNAAHMVGHAGEGGKRGGAI